MAATPIEFDFPAGQTLAVDLFAAPAGGAAIASALAATEQTAPGTYRITHSGAQTGVLKGIIKIGGTRAGAFFVHVAADDTTVYVAVDSYLEALNLDAAVSEVEGGGGGEGGTHTTSIVPVTREHKIGEPSPIGVAAYVDADFVHAFTFAGDLRGEEFTFAVETSPGKEDIAADYDPSISYDAGDDQTTITPTIARANHTVANLGEHQYALRHVSGTNAPIARGSYHIEYAPDSVDA